MQGGGPGDSAWGNVHLIRFYLPALGKTAAELAPEDKNRLSHRGQALQKLLALLKAP